MSKPRDVELEELIRLRAYQLWQQRGDETTAVENWLEAEKQVLAEEEHGRALVAAAS